MKCLHFRLTFRHNNGEDVTVDSLFPAKLAKK